MTITIRAIYQDGIFKPLEPISLNENTSVHLVVSTENPFLKFAGILDTVEADNMMKLVEEEFERIEKSEWEN